MEKLKILAEMEGYNSIKEMLSEGCYGSSVPAICMNKGCNATYLMEPDMEDGFCEECRTNTVSSALIIAGLI